MRSSTLYSIIIPTYNRGNLVQEAIESILEQGYNSIEIIVIDDGSTDNTKEIVLKYGSKVIYQYQLNQGASVARNNGIKLATGKYISFLDSDDLFLPGKMKREQENFLRFPDVEATASDAEYFKNGVLLEKSWMKFKGLEIKGIQPRIMNANELNWLNGSMFATCNLTLHRDVIQKLGGTLFDTDLKRGQDWDLEIRIIQLCTLLIDPQVTCQIRRLGRIKQVGDWRKVGSEANLKYQKALMRDKTIFTKALRVGQWSTATNNLIKERIVELNEKLSQFKTISSNQITI